MNVVVDPPVRAALERWDEISASHALRAVSASRILEEAALAGDGSLRGLLFSVKDLLPVAGVESCAGSLTLVGHVPPDESPLLAAVRGAGAVVFGKGVCAEFGFGVDTENRLDGRVTHPTHPDVSPGGSSGGDAVAVGAGVVDFAIAGDYGGSVRWPAQATRVLGLRLGVGRAPATDRIGAPRHGQQSRLEVPGVLARDADVMRRVVTTLVGENDVGRPTRRLVLTLPARLGTLSPGVEEALDRLVHDAERSGYEIVDGSPTLAGALEASYDVYRRLRELTDHHEGVRSLVSGREGLLCETTRAVLAAAAQTTAGADRAEVVSLEHQARTLMATVRRSLVDADALVLPLAPTGAIGFGEQVTAGATAYDAAALHSYLRAVSLTGLPALSVPMGDGVSIQLVGTDGAEALLCDLAAEVAQ